MTIEEKDRDRELEGRRKLAAILAEYSDSFSTIENGLVTSYILVYEITTPKGKCVSWLTGNGFEPTEDDLGGAYAWTLEGMLRKTIREINAAPTAIEDDE